MPAIANVLVGLGQNLVLLLVVLWLYRLVYPHERAAWRLPALVLGGLVGGIGLLGDALPIAAPGALDSQMLLIVLASAWAGPFAALAAGGLGALYRLWLGGPAMGIIGGCTLLSGAALGTLAWYWCGRRPLLKPAALMLLGVVGAVASILWAVLLPAEIAGPMLANGAIAILVAYPIAAPILGSVFAQDLRRATAEAALRINEARYRTLVSHLPNSAVLLFDHNLRFTLAEGAGLAEVGLFQASLEGKTIWEVFPIDICRVLEPPFRAALASTSVITEIHFQERIYSLHTVPVPDPQGGITAGMAMAQDMTADRQAQAALKESEERYARLADATFEGIGFCEDDIIFDANERLAEMLGYTRHELIGIPTEQLVAPRSREQVRRRVLSGYQKLYEHLALHKDGSVFPVEVRSRSLSYRGRAIRVTVVRDMRERVAAQHALAASELRFRSAFHANPTPQILTHADDGTFLDVNVAYERLLGWSRDELLGKRTNELPIWVNLDRAKLLDTVAAAGRLRDWPTQVRDKAGALHDLILSIEPVQLGDAPCWLCVMIDVTARLAAEQALARSERIFKELVQSLNAVVWEADAQTFMFSFVSEQAEKLLGYPTSDWLATPSFWADHIHPADRDRAIEYCVHCTQALEHHEFEYRMIAADGRVVWLRDFVTVMADSGQPTRLRGVMVDITARKQTEAALRDSEARFRTMFEWAAIGIALVDLSGHPIVSNPALEAMLGYSADELRHMTFAMFTHPSDVDADLALFGELIGGTRESYRLEKRYLRKDGQVVWGYLSVSLVRDNAAEPLFAIGMVEDITERKRIEQQYLQAQKMDAIGRLAGGVAHDFNNLLTVILGSSELLLDELALDHPLRPDIVPIQDAAARASTLTRQLLAFSRQQVLQPGIVNLNTIVASVEKLLRRLIGEDITLVTHLTEHLGTVRADPSQLEQVLLNLVVNARDAMENGGTLIIETANVMLEAGYAQERGDISSGPYVQLAISDTGYGMDASTQARIFEPFFTTKEPGRGTGLGLATVYGIIRQSGGHVWVYSEIGNGTTFKVYLPQVVAPAGITPSVPDLALAPQDTGTILLVEDEPLVRALASRILRARGYLVLEADDGVAALRIAADHQGQIDVLLTDVIMPGGLSGPQVAKHLFDHQPGLRVLYMSGYTDAMIAHHTAFASRHNLLQKPFTSVGLAHAVWNVRHAPEQQGDGVEMNEAGEPYSGQQLDGPVTESRSSIGHVSDT
jgi:PAS domain S-box-containing protein